MFKDRYEELAAKLWDYLEEQVPQDPELRDSVHAETLHYMDELLRENGVSQA